jgi:putative CocE/NonD family hydrolase
VDRDGEAVGAQYRRGVAATLVSAAAARALRLSPGLTRQVRVRRGLGLRTRDGVILRTDHYAPALDSAPTVLIRSPYGRGGLVAVVARVMAEQGFHVVVQSCRGTGGSTGRFYPMRHERDDGLDTVEWLRRQPWFTGRLGTFGPSYVGYTQWAIADVPELAAMATVVTASQFRDPTYAGESFSLFTTLAWACLLQAQQGPWLANAVELIKGQPRLHGALASLPLGEADWHATGAEIAFFRRWLSLAGARMNEIAGYWDELGHSHRLPGVKAAVLMVGGWHDIFLPWQLADYAALREAGVRTRLVIGPWHHGSLGLAVQSLRESVLWLRAHLGYGSGAGPTRGVRVAVEPGGRWREFADWPPPHDIQAWYLHPEGGLSSDPPVLSHSDSFVYDPADPTPSVGGPVLVGKLAGPRDNSELEARPDVLVYTGAVLRSDLEIVGPVRARIAVRASRPYFDVFVRVCDANPDGRSINVCDGLTRIVPQRWVADADAVMTVDVDLWPAAYRFRRGHRVRLQVSAGAHPRYARNPGTDHPLGEAVELRPVEIEVFHGPDRPSAVLLPRRPRPQRRSG